MARGYLKSKRLRTWESDRYGQMAFGRVDQLAVQWRLLKEQNGSVHGESGRCGQMAFGRVDMVAVG